MTKTRSFAFVLTLFAATVITLSAQAKPIHRPDGPIVLDEALLIGRVGRTGRVAIHIDPIQAQIVLGQWQPPAEGDEVISPVGDAQTWGRAQADEDGWFKDDRLRGGYACLAVPSDTKRIVLLEASGHSLVYVNGVLRAGDPYRTGFVRLPIPLIRGQNHLLFACSRGQLRVQLSPAEKPVSLDTADATLPDARVGERIAAPGAVVVINATGQWQHGLVLESSGEGLEARRVSVPDIPPMATRKVAFELRGAAPAGPGKCAVTLTLRSGEQGGEPLDAAELDVPIVDAAAPYRVTFRSHIDGSVQYYAVNPAQPVGGMAARPALVLSLHGAGVEARGQAAAYASKTWAHIVAATNRRPFGFDWEDWGRLDALEVLSHAGETLATDPQRTYLTGHSMGGHGVWQLGALLPDKFAAIGPSAGWISFTSYTGASKIEGAPPIVDIIRRSALASDTLTFLRNYLHHGIYVLHGDQDDNVPPSEARAMREKLAEFHPDFAYHEQPDAGHWWDASDEPGTSCVDWPPMFDMFARRRLPFDDEVRRVEFATVNPEISATSHWATIWQQQVPQTVSSLNVLCDPHQRRFTGTTDNVRVLRVSLRHLPPDRPVKMRLDDQRLDDVAWPTDEPVLWLRNDEGGWSVTAAPPSNEKSPRRSGLFKHAFNHHVMFVVGTHGTPDENAWALAKARYDAEMFWYRGNASVDIVRDNDLDVAEADRSVIIYGNADTNSAWQSLLGDCPVSVRAGNVTIGDRSLAGDDQAVLFVYPRAGSDSACIGVVGGSGLVGMRLTDRAPYFVSGVGYPDCLVYTPGALLAAPGSLKAAGYFGNDWGVESGEFAFED